MIKFTGKFKDLKDRGFKFLKLFASNYKVYRKENIYIWVAHGGYVELGGLGDRSGLIMKTIIEDKYPVYEEDFFLPAISGDKPFFKKGEPRTVMIDDETDELIPQDVFIKKYRDKYKTLEEYFDFKSAGFTELILHKRHLDAIKELKDVIEFV